MVYLLVSKAVWLRALETGYVRPPTPPGGLPLYRAEELPAAAGAWPGDETELVVLHVVARRAKARVAADPSGALRLTPPLPLDAVEDLRLLYRDGPGVAFVLAE